MSYPALWRIGALVAGLALGAAGAVEPTPDAVAQFGDADAPRHLMVRAAADIAFFAPVVQAFIASRPGLRITWEDWNTNALNTRAREICDGSDGVTDLVLSSAADLQVDLVNAGCAQPYRSALTDALPPERNWRDELFGVTEEPVVMVFNSATLPEEQLPQSRFDLLDLLRSGPALNGRIATYDISTSGVGYLLAFQDSLQASTFGGLLEAFGRAGAVATCCSAEIIQGVRDGKYLVAYNILGAYAFAMARNQPDLRIVMPSDYMLVLHRAAYIPKSAPNPDDAGDFVDFMLSPAGQKVLASQGLIAARWKDDPASPYHGDIPQGAMRPIQLSPALRLGLDEMKRATFLRNWVKLIRTDSAPRAR